MADNWQLKAVLSANAQGMIKALGDVGKMAKTTRKYLVDIARSAGHLSAQIGLPSALAGGLLAGFSASAVKNAMVGLADMEDEVSKFSATTGVAGAQFKKFQYLAQLSNVPFEALTGNLVKLNKGIFDAANGKSDDLASLFTRLGIKTRDANGQLRSAADMLPQLADAFARNENPAVRARIGVALFGKSWQEIMPMLADGAGKINERLARFRELGLEVKDIDAFEKQMEDAGRLGDRLDDLGFVAKGFQNTIATGLLPVLTPLLDDLIKWIVVNKDLVAGEVKSFVGDLAQGLRAIDWRSIAEGARNFAHGLGEVVSWIGGAKNALIALALVMNAQTIAAFVGLLGSVGRLSFALGGLALKALAPVAPLQTLTTGLTAAELRAATLTNTVGRLGAALGVAGAAFAGWGIGTWLNDNVINPGMEMLTGQKGQTLGGWVYDQVHPDQAEGNLPSSVVAQRPSLVGQPQVRASGQIDININGAPPGTRVEQVRKTGDVPIRADVGTRWSAAGAY